MFNTQLNTFVCSEEEDEFISMVVMINCCEYVVLLATINCDISLCIYHNIKINFFLIRLQGGVIYELSLNLLRRVVRFRDSPPFWGG